MAGDILTTEYLKKLVKYMDDDERGYSSVFRRENLQEPELVFIAK